MSDWKKWLLSATVRAIKTMAQASLGMIGAAAILGDVNWAMVASGAVLAGIMSYLTSIAGLPEVDGGASLPAMIHGEDQDA